MHGSIRDRLEALLEEARSPGNLQGFTITDPSVLSHLSKCPECSKQFEIMKAQSEMLGLLRAPEGVEPAGGFYARVLQRIEERAKESMWASLIYSPMSSRIAYASLTMALLLGSYVIAAEKRDGHLEGRTEIVQTTHYDAPVVGSQSRSQQRDAVLENFAAH
jgi:predicted anti-sigma-YlaC factor YlaD